MTKTFSLVLTALLCLAPSGRAQDAATEERLNQLTGKIEDLIAALDVQKKRLSELSREIENVREQQGKPNGSYATQDEIRKLAEKLQEVDRNRERDKELILKELTKLPKTLAPPPSSPRPGRNTSASSESSNDSKPAKPDKSEKGFEYSIKAGDNFSIIAQAYREQGIKVTAEQIEKANPGVNPTKLRLGQKIFIPAPQ